MPLEPYPVPISQLDETSPNGSTEYVSEGDDHLRGIKASLKYQFPNLGPNQITVSADHLNNTITESDVIIKIEEAIEEITGQIPEEGGDVLYATTAGTAANLTRSVIPGTGLLGGGQLTQNVTLSINPAHQMTAANVGQKITELAFGAVGTYAFLYYHGTGLVEGAIVSGSQLYPAGFVSSSFVGGGDGTQNANMTRGVTAVSSYGAGNWRCMSRMNSTPGSAWSRVGLFVRIP